MVALGMILSFIFASALIPARAVVIVAARILSVLALVADLAAIGFAPSSIFRTLAVFLAPTVFVMAMTVLFSEDDGA